MPYKLVKEGRGYIVVNQETGKKYSKKPITKAKAEAQLRILNQKLQEDEWEYDLPISPDECVKLVKSIASKMDSNREAKLKASYLRKAKEKQPTKSIRAEQLSLLGQQQQELEKLKENPEEYQKVLNRHNYVNQYYNNPNLMDSLKESDPISYLKIMKMKDNDFEGGGFIDTLKASKLGKALTTTAKKISKFVSSTGQRIQGTITGRNDYPPDERMLIEKYGNLPIRAICIYREPIEGKVNTLTNILSLGQMNQLKKKYSFDEMYHLYMVLTLQESQDKNIPVLVEKNEVINIHEYPNINPNAQKMELLISPKFKYSLKQFLDNGQSAMGPKYFTYDPFDNNCQVFIMSLLSANPPLEQDNPNARKFIMQDVQGLKTDLNPISRELFRGTTGLAGRMNVLLKGYGFI